MADETQNSSDTQLEYPQLLIEASFESLLSYSHTSGPQPIMPRSELSLSESWSSLSEHDLSHEDDLQSDITDTGSLIDVSHTEDIHSVDEHGHSSDAEDIDEQAGYQDDQEIIHDSDVEEHYISSGHQSQYSSIHTRENIRLDGSTIVVDSDGVSSLQASKTFTEIDIRSTSSQHLHESASNDSVGTISMKLAPEGLKLVRQRPYHVLYYASALSSPEVKSDVLSKVGAALISAGDHHEFNPDSEYPCYHIVPSEFGPGLHPSTADLIPIPTQMHVSECTLSSVSSDTYYPRIQLQLANGKQIISRRARFCEFQDEKQWPSPDLAIIVISQNENQEGKTKAMKLAEFANRHHIPFFCLQQEAGWDGSDFLINMNSNMLHKLLQTKAHHVCGGDGRKMLLDVDSFLALDTEQFSQHLSYLTRTTKCRYTPSPSIRDQVMSQYGRIFHQFARLLPHRYAKMLDGNRGTWVSQEWVADVVTTQPKYTQSQVKEKQTSLFALGSSRERAFMLTALVKTTTAILITGLTVFVIYASSITLPYMMSKLGSAPKTLPAGHLDGFAPPCLPSTVSSATTIATTASTQVHSVAGPLQVLEQHVQSLMPIGMPRGKKRVHKPAANHNVAETKGVVAKACQNVVPAYISANIKVDKTFFDDAGEPVFHVQVLRKGEKVGAKVEKQANGAAMIMVKRKDVHGQLSIHLDGQNGQACAFIDLENSVGEAFTLWIESLRGKRGQSKTTKRFANEYTRLLEVRATKPGLVNSAMELQYSATRRIGAVVEKVERSAVKRAKSCHEDKSKCLQLASTDIMGSAQRARKLSEELFMSTRKQIVGTTQQARDKANGVSQQVHDEFSKAVQAVQSSIAELSVFRPVWPKRVTETLAGAQKQAQQLVKESKTNHRKSPQLA